MRQLQSNTSDSSAPFQVFMNYKTINYREMIFHQNILRKLYYFNTPTRMRYYGINTNETLQTDLIKLIPFIHLLIYFLITIINCSLINPGPGLQVEPKTTSINIFYQNVQGLIPFTELNKKHPRLDNTKISELQAYIHDKQPDIIVLNETWLKNTILDQEILPSSQYKIFRCDRTEDSHPPDKNNPLKYRRNGGGVLIAISCSLKVSSNIIDLKCKAEMIAIELVLDDGSKIVISTCYRVGTLGTSNYQEIVNALQKLLRKKRLKKFSLVGDFNLSSTNWVTNLSTHSTEQMFLDAFIRLGLLQCISKPTHVKNNILDIVLTNSDNYISNIKLLSDHEACKSDHFAITFKIKLRVERKKPIKTKSFNFKHANWEQLNTDLNNINWISFLDCLEPDLAWPKFKQILNYFLEIHVPKITVKHNSGPP